MPTQLSETRTRPVELKIEAIESAWEEMRPLVARHFAEVVEKSKHRKPVVDVEGLSRLEKVGLFKLLTARQDGRLVGYYTWTLNFDLESYGTLVANQGGWYVEPGYFGVGQKLFEKSIKFLNSLGVKVIYLHHRMEGRGNKLGRFFARRGARLVQHTYELDL